MISCNLQSLAMFVRMDDEILIDENQLICRVVKIDSNQVITCKVIKGGVINSGSKLTLRNHTILGPILKPSDIQAL